MIDITLLKILIFSVIIKKLCLFQFIEKRIEDHVTLGHANVISRPMKRNSIINEDKMKKLNHI